MLSQDQGERLVRLARLAIESHFSDEDVVMSNHDFLQEKKGVFVTLTKDGELRGCIGMPEPVLPLGEAVVRAARSAAFGDPRFPPLKKDEDFEVEVSVLTRPEECDVPKEELCNRIEVGEDGLIVRSPTSSGLLLPQVASGRGWDSEEFLCQTCVKAGLPPDAWLRESVKVFKFQCQVFHEE